MKQLCSSCLEDVSSWISTIESDIFHKKKDSLDPRLRFDGLYVPAFVNLTLVYLWSVINGYDASSSFEYMVKQPFPYSLHQQVVDLGASTCKIFKELTDPFVVWWLLFVHPQIDHIHKDNIIKHANRLSRKCPNIQRWSRKGEGR